MHFQVMRDGQSYGPYTLEDLQRYVTTGNVLPTDLAKSDEMAEWLPVAQLLSATPPPPPAPGFAQPMFYGQTPAGTTSAPSALYPYFPVSTGKFIVMALVTFGIYQVYWAYKQWNRIAARTGEPMLVWARAIFLGIWNFALFSRLRDDAKADGIPVRWNPVVLGIAVIVFAITSRLPGGFSILVFLSFLAYLGPVQTIQAINRQHAATVTEPLNSRFSGWNIAGIVCGGLLLGLTLLGLGLQAMHLAIA